MENVPSDLDGFRAHVRAFIEREVEPHADACARERSVSRALHAAAGEAGLFALKYDSADGGLGRPYAFTQAMLEIFGASGRMGSLLSLVLQSEFSSPHLALHGSPSIKERFL